jgi:putative Mn2+ efflux pump MntP
MKVLSIFSIITGSALCGLCSKFMHPFYPVLGGIALIVIGAIYLISDGMNKNK